MGPLFSPGACAGVSGLGSGITRPDPAVGLSECTLPGHIHPQPSRACFRQANFGWFHYLILLNELTHLPN